MAKLITLLVIVALLPACSVFGRKDKPIRVRSEVQEVFVPLMYCPAPPVIKRPVLPIDNIPPGSKITPGEIAQRIKASLVLLKGYTEELEVLLEQYNSTSDSYDVLQHQLVEDLKKKMVKSSK